MDGCADVSKSECLGWPQLYCPNFGPNPNTKPPGVVSCRYVAKCACKLHIWLFRDFRVVFRVRVFGVPIVPSSEWSKAQGRLFVCPTHHKAGNPVRQVHGVCPQAKPTYRPCWCLVISVGAL